MNEYAPEYTKRERILILLRHLTWAVPVFLATAFWFLPWFGDYVEQSHCFNYGSFTGTHVVLYFVFVANPISLALVVFAFEGPRAIKVMQLGQNPLPGEKVYTRKKYRYGNAARVQPLILLLILLCLVGLGIQGVFWANELIDDRNRFTTQCDDV